MAGNLARVLGSLGAATLLASALSTSCGGNADVASSFGGNGGGAADASVGGTGGNGGSGASINLDSGADVVDSGADACDGCEPLPGCGDGVVDPGEACDDGNSKSGDGCTAACDAIEQDYACPEPGKPCVSTVKCGDSKITGSETCDDGNANAGDGCGADCKVEPGYKCPTLGVKCEAADCGDSIVAGAEQCDDGNKTAGDGCSDACKLEKGWACATPGKPCKKTVCGDGIPEGTEQCDDGNNDMGDGCTPFCVNEPDCTAGACKSACGDGMKLPGDNEECEDGNTQAGDGCSPTCKVEPGYKCTDVVTDPATLVLPIVIRDFKAKGTSGGHPDFEAYLGTDKGIVKQALGVAGKPEYSKATGGTPTTTGKAPFDQWYRDTAGVNQTVLQSLTLNKIAGGVFQYNNGNFFPIDGQLFGNQGNAHNFHFTSEVRYWFEYKGGEQLDFTGDDDVFTFVNKTLAIDLGGVHGAQSASVTLNAAAAAAYGLTAGKVYEIVVFQAERHTVASNYKLTLSGFANKTSNCASVCGDGVKTPDEQCDDGVLAGGYDKCGPGCVFGEYCGDGAVQSGEGEECDDGTNLTPYGATGCAPGCKEPAFCGDGDVQSLFGEQCDDGVNAGGYGKCASGCKLGPRCGDGIVQSQETCDDGNSKSGDGCSSKCQTEGPR